MIDVLDAVLRHLLSTRVRSLAAGTPPSVVDGQVGSQAPDDDWRKAVQNLGGRRALNVHLADLRENADLRSTERVRSVRDGLVEEHLAPLRLACHYLISAWSPATDGAERVREEHRLLAETVAVLARHRPLEPRRVYAPAPLPAGFPAGLDAELPAEVVPPEGFPRLAEFWDSMGTDSRWRPAVHLCVTVPAELDPTVAGPMVTTVTTWFTAAAEGRSVIGGTVLDDRVRPAAGLAGASVALTRPDDTPVAATATDAGGRFVFAGLLPGSYRLRAGLRGRPSPPPRDVEVPSPVGEYDLTLP